MAVTTTMDIDVVIEEDIILPEEIDPVSGNAGARRVTYRSLSTGRRWQVLGNCDRRGDCLIGAVVNGLTIRTRQDLADPHLAEIDEKRTHDTPVTPKFKDCCPFTYVELAPVQP